MVEREGGGDAHYNFVPEFDKFIISLNAVQFTFPFRPFPFADRSLYLHKNTLN